MGGVATADQPSETVEDTNLAAGEARFFPVIIVFLALGHGHEDRVPAAQTSRGPNVGALDSPRVVALDIAVPSSTQLSTLRDEIAAGIAIAIRDSDSARHNACRRDASRTRLPDLTAREREVLQLILEGFPNKNIAADLGISMRTVEHHRAAIMKKSGCRSLPALVRLALEAGDWFAASSERA